MKLGIYISIWLVLFVSSTFLIGWMSYEIVHQIRADSKILDWIIIAIITVVFSTLLCIVKDQSVEELRLRGVK